MKFETTFFDAPARILRGNNMEEAIKDIVRLPGQEDAFYVLNVGDIVHKIKSWKLEMPRVKPFYAVKCNDNHTVLQILASLGTGFDCASKSEIQHVRDLGVAPARIIYAHPCKPASHIRHALAAGVKRMTFDNETELFKVKAIMPDAELVIRIRCDATKAQCELMGVKFGVVPELSLPLLERAKELGLNVVGVSFHVGSGCQEPQVFLRAIKAAREVFDSAIALGLEPFLLDIGGGFPGERGSSLKEIAHWVNTALEQHFPQPNIEVIAEPGRYMVASAFTLATQVVAKRRVAPTEEEEAAEEGGTDPTPSFMYYINDGVYGSFNCILFDNRDVVPELLDVKLRSASEGVEDGGSNNEEGETSAPLFSCSIWGPTCDSLDRVVPNMQLPEMEIGDWFVWQDMGAYTCSAAGNFNGFSIPPVNVVVPFHTWLWFEGALSSSLMLQNTMTDGGVVRAVASPPFIFHSGVGDQVTSVTFEDHLKEAPDTSSIDHLNNSFKHISVAEI